MPRRLATSQPSVPRSALRRRRQACDGRADATARAGRHRRGRVGHHRSATGLRRPNATAYA